MPLIDPSKLDTLATPHCQVTLLNTRPTCFMRPMIFDLGR